MDDHDLMLLRQELLKKDEEEKCERRSLQSRRWFIRALAGGTAGAVALGLVESSQGACTTYDNGCNTNTCAPNTCDSGNVCQTSNSCTGNTCSAGNICQATNTCAGGNTETCASANACVSDACNAGNTCNLNACTTNTCKTTDSCEVDKCGTADKCATNACDNNACSTSNICTADDDCWNNACPMTDTDCGLRDISCYYVN